MTELIPSRDMREYLSSINHTFSDFEKAELIYNNSLLSLEERDHALEDLKISTKDQSLAMCADSCFEHNLRLDDVYFVIPYPFLLGDVVRVLGRDLIGIVIGPKNQEEKEAEYKRYLEKKDTLDFSDCAIVVEFPDEQGHFSHYHINPMYLEYAMLEEGSPDEMILSAARDIVQGMSTIEYFQYCCVEYSKAKAQCQC